MKTKMINGNFMLRNVFMLIIVGFVLMGCNKEPFLYNLASNDVIVNKNVKNEEKIKEREKNNTKVSKTNLDTLIINCILNSNENEVSQDKDFNQKLHLLKHVISLFKTSNENKKLLTFYFLNQEKIFTKKKNLMGDNALGAMFFEEGVYPFIRDINFYQEVSDEDEEIVRYCLTHKNLMPLYYELDYMKWYVKDENKIKANEFNYGEITDDDSGYKSIVGLTAYPETNEIYVDKTTEQYKERLELLAHLIHSEAGILDENFKKYTGLACLNREQDYLNSHGYTGNYLGATIFRTGVYEVTWGGTFYDTPNANDYEIADYLLTHENPYPLGCEIEVVKDGVPVKKKIKLMYQTNFPIGDGTFLYNDRHNFFISYDLCSEQD